MLHHSPDLNRSADTPDPPDPVTNRQAVLDEAVTARNTGGAGTFAETMTVTVRDRSAESPWGSGPVNPRTREVTISAYCRTCGGRRGKPKGRNEYDDGAWYWVQTWDNPCGHIDRYADVIAEANTEADTVEGTDR